MITYQRLPFIRVAEFYFDEETPAARADIVRHLWRSAPVSGTRCEESHTLVLDLTSSPETLLAKMHNGTRWSIRRADKDQFQYEFWCAGEPEAVAEFCGFYDAFAKGSHLVSANRKRLSALTQLGVLDLSRVSDNAGRALVWHAHYRASHRVRMIHSASLLGKATDPSLRGLIGRANCHNTWCDILRFQQQGLPAYDLGGWHGGAEDQKKLRINRFKESFGGALVKEFNAEIGVTAKGRLALDMRAVLLSSLGRYGSWKVTRGPQRQTAAHLH